jgi:hypothetical protein
VLRSVSDAGEPALVDLQRPRLRPPPLSVHRQTNRRTAGGTNTRGQIMMTRESCGESAWSSPSQQSWRLSPSAWLCCGRGVVILGRSAGGSSMSPTIPACDGRWLAEGITYRFRDPQRGEIVVIHARGQVGSPVVPDPGARDLNLGKRVIGDTGRHRGRDRWTGHRQRHESGRHPDGPLPAHSPCRRRVLRHGRQPELFSGQPGIRTRPTRCDLRACRSQLLATRTVRCPWLRQEPDATGRRLSQ